MAKLAELAKICKSNSSILGRFLIFYYTNICLTNALIKSEIVRYYNKEHVIITNISSYGTMDCAFTKSIYYYYQVVNFTSLAVNSVWWLHVDVSPRATLTAQRIAYPVVRVKFYLHCICWNKIHTPLSQTVCFYHSFTLHHFENRTRPISTPNNGRCWWDSNNRMWTTACVQLHVSRLLYHCVTEGNITFRESIKLYRVTM